MRSLRHSSRWALLCLFFFSSAITAGALAHGKGQETSIPANLPGPTSKDHAHDTASVPTSSVGLPIHRRSSSTGTLPAPLDDAAAGIFNDTLPEGKLPLEPHITPGWAVSGTILLGTGVVHALLGVRAKRVHTFFSAAFLAALGTTVVILYLMTPPVSLAVQGAFVVAAVCTGAALGGLAVLFRDLAECLGCLLGGFSFSMWLLTLHPGGLVRHSAGKTVFIGVFSLMGFCLYFSRWTRAYGLVACISLSGAAAAVLGIDCFSHAGLKEFWAYIWELNDDLFPDGTVTYPLTRGIRVELAITILLFVVGIISQLELWRLIQNRRNRSKDETNDEELGLPDEEENIGRQVEEVTNRERREWERVYGDGGNTPHVSVDSTVGGMEGEKPEVYNKHISQASITTDVQTSVGLSGQEQATEPTIEAHQVYSVMEKDVDGGRVTVRVVEDDVAEGDATAAVAPQHGDDGSIETPTAPETGPGSQLVPEPPIVPLPFKIPTAQEEKDPNSEGVEGEDGSSIAAVAGEEEQQGAVLPEAGDTLLPEHPVRYQRSLSRRSTVSNLDKYVAAERFGVLVLPTKAVRNDSIIANMDDESMSGEAETSATGSMSRYSDGCSPSGSEDGNQEEVAASWQQTTTPRSTDDTRESKAGPPSLDRPHLRDTAKTPSSSTGRPPGDIVNTVRQKQAVSEVAPHNLEGSGLGSTTSFRAFVARLTRLNLPTALPDVALTYRTNEWAKHLSIADIPDPEVLQLPEPAPEALSEQPAPLDIIELQQTAETGTPPPAPKLSTALSNYPQHLASGSISSTSLSDSEMAMSNLPPGSQSDPRAHRRSVPAPLKRQNTRFPIEPAVEKHSDSRRNSAALQQGTTQAQSAGASGHRRSTSTSLMPTHDVPHKVYPQTKHPNLIGMREKLLRSRASVILTPTSGNAFQAPPNPSATKYTPADAGGAQNYPVRSPTPSSLHRSSSSRRASADIDLDDLPLSQRRSIIRHRQSRSPTNTNNTTNNNTNNTWPTPPSPAFDSHQPRRGTCAMPTAVRHAQLASFRNSVAVDLRPSSPPTVSDLRRMSSSATLLDLHSLHGGNNPSMTSLHSTAAAAALGVAGVTTPTPTADKTKTEAMRSIELQRGYLLVEKAAQAQRREAEAMGRIQQQREFEELMRSGVLMDAHRDAMRRLQGGVRG